MTTYGYRCPNGHDFDVICAVNDYTPRKQCPDCEALSDRYLTAPLLGFVRPDVCYDSPIDGRPITSWAQRRDDLARNGCQEYDPEMRKDAERHRRAQDDALDRAVEQTVEKEISTMPGAKRERLANELSAGLTADIERRSV